MSDWDLPTDLGPSRPELIMPVVEPLGDGFANISWPEDKITAHLEGMWRAGARFEVVLRITHRDYGTIHALTRINLLSTSARTDLVRTLEKRYPNLGWNVRVDGIVEAADKVYRADLKVTTPGEKPPEAINYLVRPIIEEGKTTAIAADPGTGKSMLAAAIALHVGGHGPVLPPFPVPAQPGKTLYLDWEDEEDTHGIRLHALLNGAGRKAPPLPIRHMRMRGMLTDAADRVIRICRTEQPRLVVVDSVGSAVVGHINEPEYVLPLMDVCRAMKTSVLLLGHLPKHESDGRLIGTIFWVTIPRQAWHLTKEQEEGEAETRLVLKHVKPNNAMLAKPIGLKVEFANDGDLLKTVRYYSTDIAKDPRTERHALPVERLVQFWLQIGRTSLKIASEETGIPYETVKKTANRHEGKHFIRFGPPRSKDAEWGVLDKGHLRDTNGTVAGQFGDTRFVKGHPGGQGVSNPHVPQSQQGGLGDRDTNGVSRNSQPDFDDVFDALEDERE